MQVLKMLQKECVTAGPFISRFKSQSLKAVEKQNHQRIKNDSSDRWHEDIKPLSSYVLVIVVLCFQGCVFQTAFALLAVMFAK